MKLNFKNKIKNDTKRKLACSMLIATTLVGSVPVNVLADIRFDNNLSLSSDYKLSETDVNDIKNKIDSSETTVASDNGRNININDKRISYLIENNIISREESITLNDGSFNVTQGDLKLTGNMKRSDFLMGVYKSIYGPINSRPIVYGDSVYVSPNVTELYLSELLNKSIIKTDELLSLELSDMIKNRTDDAKPRWDNTLEPYNIRRGENISGIRQSSLLGMNFFVSEGGNSFTATRQNSDYFVNEKISTYEALLYIEDILRLTEKDLTKAEVDLICYKYGTSYILDLPEETRETVAYLIAMGVLDFENPGEFGNLYDTLSTEYGYTLMYRLKNKASRKDFSKIQLNDTENQLMKEGFIEQALHNISGFTGSIPKTLEVKELSPEDYLDPDSVYGGDELDTGLESGVTISRKDSLFDTILTGVFGFTRNSPRDNGEVIYADPSSSLEGFKGFRVTKLFLDGSSTMYKGELLDNLVTNNKYKDFEEIKECTRSNEGIVITFDIQAPTAVQAVASVDSRITITDGASKNDGNVNTITQVTKDGTKMSYISDKELKNKFSEISVINSKTLKNRKTGDTAMLLSEHNMALVGNKVIRSKADMVIRLNGIEYYNLDLILPLMTNAFISQIDPGSLYTNVKLPEEWLATVEGSSLDLEKTPVTRLSEINGGRTVYMYNSVLMTRGISTLIRDFTIKDNLKATVVIDWTFVAPDEKLMDMAKTASDRINVKGLTDYLHTRPENGELQDWWDNNIEISNALANVMYDTTNKPQSYITSGYLAPSVYILVPDKTIETQDVITKIFGDMKLPKSYVDKYLNGNINDFYNILFNGRGDDNTLKSRRSFQVLRGTYTSGAGNGYAIYEDRFAVMDTGAVYRSFESDSRIQLVKSGDDYTIRIHERAPDTNIDVNKRVASGTPVTLNGKEYVINGYSGSEGQEGLYYRLVPKEPIQGTPKKLDNGDWTIASADGNDLIKATYDEVTRELPTGTYRPWDDISAANRAVRGHEIKKGDHYLVNNKIMYAHAEDDQGIAKLKTDNEYKESDTKAYYTIYLHRNEWKVIDGKMVLQKTNPYLQNGNLFYSGLNNSLISRILDQSTVTVPYNKVPTGAKVLIGSYEFMKSNGDLHSYPINDQGLTNQISEALTGKTTSGVESSVLQLFTGMTLDYSGRAVPLTSYIKEAGLGRLLDKDKASNTLYETDNNVRILASSDSNPVNIGGGVPTSVCVRIKPNNDVYFRLIDKEEKVYVLSTTSNKFAEGYIDDVSAFYETLDLASLDDLYLVLEGSRFEPLDNASEYVQDFLNKYKETLKLDRITTLKFWLTVFISYLIIISWLAFGILQLNVGKNFLLAFRESTNVGGYDNGGVDFVKIFTLGTYTLDDNLHASKLFVGNILMFLMLYLVLDVLFK